MGRKQTHAEVLDQWTERDLTRAASADELPRAFEMDDTIEALSELIEAGRRPIITGDSGVGKTAAVYEIARRAARGEGPEALHGKRIVQFSIRRRAASLKDPHNVRPEFQKLIDALMHDEATDVVPFFSDMHLTWDLNLEPLMQSLAFRCTNPILAEAEPMRLQAMLEYFPEIEQHYSILNIDEPDLPRARRILEAWSAHQADAAGRRYTPEALTTALDLCHRFLARSRLPRKVLDLLNQLGISAGKGERVDQGDVIERFCATHKVPRTLIDPAEPLDLAEVESRFANRVLGQEEAIKAVVSMIGLIKAGLSDARRPFGVFLFVGPTGVGKTHLAQLLADTLFGSADRMVRLNMADYPDEHSAHTVFGNPEAQNPAEQRGVLTQRILGYPFAVVLLDEFEKAHAKVHDRFMQMFDEGSFINGAGETISCRSMILITTSNAGAEVYRGSVFGFTGGGDVEGMSRELDRQLERHFRFEFLNRFDQIVHFHPLSRRDIRTIARRELEQLEHRAGIRQRALKLEIEESVLDWLAVHGYDPDHGARFLRRTIERHVTTALADTVVREQPKMGASVQLCVRGNRVTARVQDTAPDIGGERQQVTLPIGATEQSRTLDRSRLFEESYALLDEARARLDGLEAKRFEYSNLLKEMNASGFWTRTPEQRQRLERFRELDVAIHVESRLAAPIERLRDLLEGDDERADASKLARALERAAQSLRDWTERLAEDSPTAVWLVISNADPFNPAEAWIEDLLEMERAWCRRLRLHTSIAACEVIDQRINRVVLLVEGPGAAAHLAMESGMHRMHKPRDESKQAQRARVEVIPRGTASDDAGSRVEPMQRRVDHLNTEFNCTGQLALEKRGVNVELLGTHPSTLAHLLNELEPVWRDAGGESPEVARVYGEGGSGARDPRTGAVEPRLRDVLRGDLNRFLDAWRKHEATHTKA